MRVLARSAGHRNHADLFRIAAFLLGACLARLLSFGHDAGGRGVTNHVERAAGHVEDAIHSEDEGNADGDDFFRDADGRQQDVEEGDDADGDDEDGDDEDDDDEDGDDAVVSNSQFMSGRAIARLASFGSQGRRFTRSSNRMNIEDEDDDDDDDFVIS